MYGVVRYSSAWHGVRSLIDHAPDRSIPPAEFDDSDAELSDVLSALEEADNYADWIYRLIRPYLGEQRARGRRRPRRAHRAVAPRTRVTATDLSKRCVDELAQRFAGCDEVEVLQADVAALGAEDRRFDSVVLVNVLEHIDDDVNAPRRSARGAEARRPALRLRAGVRGSVLRLRPEDRAPPPIPAVASGHHLRPGRARRGRRPLRQHGRGARLVAVRSTVRAGADAALVGEASTTGWWCRSSAGSRPAEPHDSASPSVSESARPSEFRGLRRHADLGFALAVALVADDCRFVTRSSSRS